MYSSLLINFLYFFSLIFLFLYVLKISAASTHYTPIHFPNFITKKTPCTVLLRAQDYSSNFPSVIKQK